MSLASSWQTYAKWLRLSSRSSFMSRTGKIPGLPLPPVRTLAVAGVLLVLLSGLIVLGLSFRTDEEELGPASARLASTPFDPALGPLVTGGAPDCEICAALAMHDRAFEALDEPKAALPSAERAPNAIRAVEGAVAAKAFLGAFREAGSQCRTTGLCAGLSARGAVASCGGRSGRLQREWSGDLIRRLGVLSSRCLSQACPDLSCPQAGALEEGIRDLELALAAVLARSQQSVSEMPDSLPDLRTTPLGAEARRLSRSVVALGGEVPGLFGAGPVAAIDPAMDPAHGDAFRLEELARTVAELAGWSEGLAQRVEATLERAARDQGTDLGTMDGPWAMDGLWRLRVIAMRLWRFQDGLLAVARARQGPPDTRIAELTQTWQTAAGMLATVSLDGLRLQAALDKGTSGTAKRTTIQAEGGAQCGALEQDTLRRLARDLALARTELSRCLRRAACPSPNGSGIPPRNGMSLTASGAGEGEFAAQALFDASLSRARAMARGLSIGSAPATALGTDARRYLAGEPLTVMVDPAQPACMAEPGASVAILRREAGRDRTVVRFDLADGQNVEGGQIAVDGGETARGSLLGFLTGAPLASGAYTVRTFAAPARGGGATGSASFFVEPEPPVCQGFQGVWTTDFGDLHLAVRDGEARGTYRRSPSASPGYLFGTVEEGVLTGYWTSELGTGGTRLVLEPGGRAFKGSWAQTLDATRGTGIWNGSCRVGTGRG